MLTPQGAPIAGAVVNFWHSSRDGEYDMAGYRYTGWTATDAQGRYRLAGLARGPAYRLSVVPGEGQPYPGVILRAPADPPGLEPVRFEIALKRGIIEFDSSKE